MHVLFIILIFPLMSYASFDTAIESRWQSIKDVEMNSKIRQKESIEQPAGVHLKILEATLYSHNFEYEKDCLFYKIPEKNQPGEIYIHNVSIDTPCDQYLMKPTALTKHEVYNFGVEKNKEVLKLKIDSQLFEFELQKNKTGILSTLRTVGKFNVRDYCFQVDDDCRVLVKDQCDQCQTGAYPVISSACKSQYSKVCAEKPCGERNSSACIRGYKASGYQGNYCINDSPLGICRDAYRVFCEADRLVCK